jgi:hypothetical protein
MKRPEQPKLFEVDPTEPKPKPIPLAELISPPDLSTRAGRREQRRLRKQAEENASLTQLVLPGTEPPPEPMPATAVAFLDAVRADPRVYRFKITLADIWGVADVIVDELAAPIEERAAMRWQPARQSNPIGWWRSSARLSLRGAVICRAATERGCTPSIIRSCVPAMRDDGMIDWDVAVVNYVRDSGCRHPSPADLAEYRRRLQIEWARFSAGRETVSLDASPDKLPPMPSAEDVALGTDDPIRAALADALAELPESERTLIARWMDGDATAVLPDDLLARLRKQIVDIATD